MAKEEKAKLVDFSQAIELIGKYKAEMELEEQDNKINMSDVEQVVGKLTEKKLKQYRFVQFYKQYLEDMHIYSDSRKKLERIEHCGELLIFKSTQDLKTSKLALANFCTIRGCPTCMWRKSLKEALELMVEMQYLKDSYKMDFILLTLTVPSVTGDKLEETINDINNAYHKLMRRKAVDKICMGAVRKLEITHNSNKYSKSYNKYHPHLHVLIAVEPRYFRSNDYIKQDKWLQLWKECIKDDTINQVDVRKVDSSNPQASKEMAKYCAKDNDYLYNQDVFNTMYEVLQGKQMYSKSGVFVDAKKLWDKGLLDHYLEVDTNEYIYLRTFSWYYKKEIEEHGYQETNMREMTEEEYRIYNKHLLNNEKDLDNGVSKSKSSTNSNQNS